jgi:hypothetical protein
MAFRDRLRHDRIAMWHLELLLTDLSNRWMSLSRNEKLVALAILLPLLFYSAKNSDSYVINTISALALLVIITFLIMALANAS